MLGFSAEHLIIFGVILLIFGPRYIPQLAGSIGKSTRNFKEHLSGIVEPEFKRMDDQKHDG